MDIAYPAQVGHEILVGFDRFEIPGHFAFDEIQRRAIRHVLRAGLLAGDEKDQPEILLHGAQAAQQFRLVERIGFKVSREIDGAGKGLGDVQRAQKLVADQVVDRGYGLLLYAALFHDNVLDGFIGRKEERPAEREKENNGKSSSGC